MWNLYYLQIDSVRIITNCGTPSWCPSTARWCEGTPFRINIGTRNPKYNFWRKYRATRTLTHCWQECKMVKPLRKSVYYFFKVKPKPKPSHSTPKYLLKRNWNICSHKHLYTNVYSRKGNYWYGGSTKGLWSAGVLFCDLGGDSWVCLLCDNSLGYVLIICSLFCIYVIKL